MASVFRPDLLAGRRALVTGGSSGIGLAIAGAFAAHGAHVTLLARDATRLEQARRTLAPAPVATQSCDVRDADAIEALASAAQPPDILVNCAAGNFPVPFAGMSRNAWKAVLDIVLDGTANVTRSFGARMLEAGQREPVAGGDAAALQGRAILNVVAGYAWTGAPGVSHSGAAKAGVLNLTRSLAVEWAPHVRVNAVSPGPIEGTEGMKRLADDLGLRPDLERAVPLGRMGRASEVADACLWLASPAASYVTGACIVVDGGMDARGPFGSLLLG